MLFDEKWNVIWYDVHVRCLSYPDLFSLSEQKRFIHDCALVKIAAEALPLMFKSVIMLYNSSKSVHISFTFSHVSGNRTVIS